MNFYLADFRYGQRGEFFPFVRLDTGGAPEEDLNVRGFFICLNTKYWRSGAEQDASKLLGQPVRKIGVRLEKTDVRKLKHLLPRAHAQTSPATCTC